jgi:hypothetical protein
MAETEAPASGVGIFTLTLQWEEGKQDSTLQLVPGGVWGKDKVGGQTHLVGALEMALQDARKVLLAVHVEAAVTERMAKQAT